LPVSLCFTFAPKQPGDQDINWLIARQNTNLARFLPLSGYGSIKEAEDIMKLLENDVAIITILTLLLFSLGKFQDAVGDTNRAAESRADNAIEQVP
jgi:hypothetical protein